MSGTLKIRVAGVDDLPTAIAIDDDASTLYASSGLDVSMADDHPFVVSERRRFALSIAAGNTFLAGWGDAPPVGLAVLSIVDDAPYLDQLSVRVADTRKGVGRALVRQAVRWAGSRGGSLWLTTYDHLPWNRPFYERAGFAVVPEKVWGPGIRAIVAVERASLPDPHARVVMRYGP